MMMKKLISKGKLKSQILYALTTMPIVYSAMLGMSIVEAAPVHETEPFMIRLNHTTMAVLS